MPQILVVKAWWWQMKPQALRLQPGDFPWRHRVIAHQKADSKMMPEAFSFVKIWGLIYLPLLPSPVLRLCCSVTKLCPTLWDPRDCSMPGSSVLHYLPEFTQIHVHWVGHAIQSSHPLPPASPPILNLSQHQGQVIANECGYTKMTRELNAWI